MDTEIENTITVGKVFIILFFYISIGAVFYHYFEKIRWVDAYYFVVITLSTIGYGDFYPKTDAGKIFTIFYIIIGIIVFTASVRYIMRSWHISRIERRKTHK